MKFIRFFIFLFLIAATQISSAYQYKEPCTYKAGVRTYFSKDSLIGLEDTNGHKLTPAIYTEMGGYSWNNMIIVEKDDSLYGLINIKGETILPPIYNSLSRSDHSEYRDEITVELNKKMKRLYYYKEENCFKDTFTRKLTIIDSLKTIYDDVDVIGKYEGSGYCSTHENASNHYIKEWAACGSSWGIRDTLAYSVKKGGKNFILSKNGKTILTEGYWYQINGVSENNIFVYNNDTLIVIDHNKQEIVDKIVAKMNEYKGKYRLTLTNNKGEEISVKSVKVKKKWREYQYLLNKIESNDKFYSYYTISGDKGHEHQGVTKDYRLSDSSKAYIYETEIVVPSEYDHITYEDGLFVVEKNHKKGLFSSTGKRILHCLYDDIKVEHIKNEDCYLVGINDIFSIVYSKTGKRLSPIKYIVEEYDEDCNCFYVTNIWEHVGAITKEGEVVIPTKFNGVLFIKNIFIVGDKNDKYGVYSKTGKKLIPCSYKHIYLIKAGKGNYLIGQKEDNNYVYISMDGEILNDIKINNLYYDKKRDKYILEQEANGAIETHLLKKEENYNGDVFTVIE